MYVPTSLRPYKNPFENLPSLRLRGVSGGKKTGNMHPHPYQIYDQTKGGSQMPHPHENNFTSIDGLESGLDYEIISRPAEDLVDDEDEIHHVNAFVALPSPLTLPSPLYQTSEGSGPGLFCAQKRPLLPADEGTEGKRRQTSDAAMDAGQSQSIDEEALMSAASSKQFTAPTSILRSGPYPAKSRRFSNTARQLCPSIPTSSRTCCGDQMAFTRTPSPTDEPSERTTEEVDSDTSLEDSCEIGPLYADDPDGESSGSDRLVCPRFTNFTRRKLVSKKQIDGESAQVASRPPKKMRSKPRVRFAHEKVRPAEKCVAVSEQ